MIIKSRISVATFLFATRPAVPVQCQHSLSLQNLLLGGELNLPELEHRLPVAMCENLRGCTLASALNSRRWIIQYGTDFYNIFNRNTGLDLQENGCFRVFSCKFWWSPEPQTYEIFLGLKIESTAATTLRGKRRSQHGMFAAGKLKFALPNRKCWNSELFSVD